MPSIYQILKSQNMLSSNDYTTPSMKNHALFLYSKDNIISPESIAERRINVSIGDLGFKYGTPSNPHDPIHLGFATTQTLTSAMNPIMIAEQIHNSYNGSTNINSIFKDIFPNISDELLLHEKSDGIKSNIFNKQWYLFGPVEKNFQDEIKKEYSQIMGEELLPF